MSPLSTEVFGEMPLAESSSIIESISASALPFSKWFLQTSSTEAGSYIHISCI